MFEEEISPHKALKETSHCKIVSRNMYSDINGDSGIITPKSTDETDEGEDNFLMNRPSDLSTNMSSSNENMRDVRDLEVEEIIRKSGEEEEEEEEEIPSSQPMPPMPPLLSKQGNIKETNVSKASRLPHLLPSPEPAVLNMEMKKKIKKIVK